MTQAGTSSPGSRLWSDVVAVLPAWVAARVLVSIGYVLAIVVSNRLLTERPEQIGNGLLA